MANFYRNDSMGQLARLKLKLQNPTTGTIDGWQPGRTYATTATVRGQKTGIRGNERLRGLQFEATSTHLIRIRYRTDVTAESRFVDVQSTGNVWNCSAAPLDQDGRKRWLFCEVTQDG